MCSRGNWMSMTAPMHWTMRPWAWGFALMDFLEWGSSDGGCAAHDLGQFLGDGRLARLVVDERELVDHARCVVARRLHRDHPRRLLAREVLGDGLVDDLLDVAREELVEDDARLRLVDVVPVGPAGARVALQAVGRERQELLDHRLLLHGVHEARV